MGLNVCVPYTPVCNIGEMKDSRTKSHLRILKVNYEDACNNYLLTLLNMWELSVKDGFWVQDRVGTIYVHESDVSFGMDEIILLVERNVSEDTYRKYCEYCFKCSEYNFNTPKLESYLDGCPLIPQSTFDRLDALMGEINKCINDTKTSLEYGKTEEEAS